jgi:glycosyltransferase involved in cell wall biosynthesis
MSLPVFALGVLAHDEEGSIVRMLRSVAAQSLWRRLPPERRQIVVYANGCSDRTAEAARAAGIPGLEVVETPQQGKSRGWNELKRHLRADAPLWFFADADVILHWRGAAALAAAADEHPEALVLSSTCVSSARFVPVRERGFLEAAFVESERLKDPRRMVSARFYAMRRETAEAIELPPGLLNEDLYLSRLIGSDRIWRSPEARVIAREPSRLGDIVRYQVRTRIGSFQARTMDVAKVDSNRGAAAMARRTASYRRLSWKAKLGKLLWVPLRLYVEVAARRVSPQALRETFWMKVDSAKLGGREQLAERLAAPEELLASPTARFVKDHRRTAVAAVSVDGRELVVKRFKPYAWYRRLEGLVLPSPARRSWRAARALELGGFHPAPALGFVERSAFGLPADSYFIMAAVEGAVPAGQWWLEQGAAARDLGSRRALLRTFARELRRFHDAGFYTRDANANNFLVRRQPSGDLEIFVLDLENVRRPGRVSRRRRVKNLVQAGRPVRSTLGARDRMYFLAAYLGGWGEIHDWLPALDVVDERKERESRRRSARRTARGIA